MPAISFINSTRSGVMVDGIVVGTGVVLERTEEGEMHISEQDFSNADLVVIGAPSSQECKEIPKKDNEKIEYYPIWAVYGKNLITSKIYHKSIEDLEKKTKIVWSQRKPYMLSGDWISD